MNRQVNRVPENARCIYTRAILTKLITVKGIRFSVRSDRVK
jgi:hypothetical protein